MAIVRDRYNNMHCSLENVIKRRNKLHQSRRKLPLFQCQIKGVNGIINYHGPFLQYTMAVYLYNFVYLALRYLYITMHKMLYASNQKTSSCSLRVFFLNTTKENLSRKIKRGNTHSETGQLLVHKATKQEQQACTTKHSQACATKHPIRPTMVDHGEA